VHIYLRLRVIRINYAINVGTSHLQFPALLVVPSSPAVPSSDLTIALSVLVPFTVLLILVISVSVPVLIFKRRKSRSEAYPSRHATRIDVASQPLYLTHTPPKEDDDLRPNNVYEKIPTGEYTFILL